MAIVQISRITHRKGLAESLPQLAGAELGWSTDTRQLFIGNGTLEEGAPVIGNTELLTQFSDIPEVSNYVYKDVAVGYEAETGPSASEPVVRTLQARLDDFASVRGYGAVGDGVADDTTAINRALLDLYCRAGSNTNPQVRRTLFFPAGVYRVTDTINIPAFAKIVGEGADATIFLLDSSSSADYVVRFADASGETGANMGAGVLPRNIEISGITIQSEELKDLMLVENALQCYFDSVIFRGVQLSEASRTPDAGQTPQVPDVAGVRFSSIPSAVCRQITFDKCAFIGLSYGVKTNEALESVTVTNSRFERLFSGIVLGDGSGTVDITGFRAVGNVFDEIYSIGIHYGNASQNISAHNVFYNVAMGFSNIPDSPVVLFGNENNVSLSDMFARTDFDNTIEPRVRIGTGTSTTSTEIKLGQLTQVSGKYVDIEDDRTDQTIFTINILETRAFVIEYTLVYNNTVRHGSIRVVRSFTGSGPLVFTDDYVENEDTEVLLNVVQVTSNLVELQYSTPDTGGSSSGFITYSVRHLA